MTALRLLIATLGVSTLVATCGGCSRSSGNATGVQVASFTENTLPLSAVTTQLLDGGAEPRLPVRTPTGSGEAQHLTLSISSDMAQKVDNQPAQHFLTPSVTIPLTATAGLRHIDLMLGQCTSTDPALTAKLSSTAGTRAALSTDGFGAVTAFQVTTDASTPVAARSAIEAGLSRAVSQTIAFPPGPIGPGAVWVIQRRVSGPVPLEQTTRARLVSRQDNLLHIDVEIVQYPKAGAQDGLPSLGSSAPADDSDHQRGHGTVVVDQTLPLPVRGSIVIDGVRSYRDPASPLRLRRSTTTTISWTP